MIGHVQGIDAGGDVELAAHEHQYIARMPFGFSHDDGGDRFNLIIERLPFQGLVDDLDRIDAGIDADNRGVVKELAEHLGVDGGAADDDLELFSLSHDILQKTKDEVDVQ